MSNWVYDEDEGRWLYWPMCAIAQCQHRVCYGLSDKYCYPHSTNGKSFGELMSSLKQEPLETTMRNVARNLQKFTTDQEASRG